MTKIKLMQDELNEMINKLMQSMFNANAIADNIAYQLENVFFMPNASDIVHHNFAHLFPVLADKVNKIQILRDSRGVRKPVVGAETQFQTAYECFHELMLSALDVEKHFNQAIDMCDDFDAKAVRIWLENLYVEMIPLTKQSVVWCNKAEQFADYCHKLDLDFEKTLIIDKDGNLK